MVKQKRAQALLNTDIVKWSQLFREAFQRKAWESLEFSRNGGLKIGNFRLEIPQSGICPTPMHGP